MDKDITLSNSVGLGLLDLAIGHVLFDTAVRHNYRPHINMAQRGD
ncbi:hypothetical protein [Arthrobacter sp. ERGS1:01]